MIVKYPLNVTEDQVYKCLKAITENEGFVTDVPDKIRDFLVPTFATVEISPHSVEIGRWTLGRIQGRNLVTHSYWQGASRGAYPQIRMRSV